MDREEIIRKMEAGTLTITDLCDSNVLRIAQEILQRRRPDLYFGEDNFAERLLSMPDIIEAIKGSAAEDANTD